MLKDAKRFFQFYTKCFRCTMLFAMPQYLIIQKAPQIMGKTDYISWEKLIMIKEIDKNGNG